MSSTTKSAPNRVDVHHHFVPPKYAAVNEAHTSEEWPAPKWSVEASQEICQKVGISTAILSLTSPGVDFVSTVEEQLEIARDANDTGAAVRDAHPTRFGFFATIPNPVAYLDEALTELARAFDQLHADGVTLMTSYSGKYLGGSAFAPLWTELNKRKAVVFIHPTSQPGDHTLVNSALLPPVLDFPCETTRTACDIIMSGTFGKALDTKIILSHGGGILPWIWHRVASLPKAMGMASYKFEQFEDQARSFYFDTALVGCEDNVEFLLKFAKEGHVLYGSDFPYAPPNLVEDMTNGLDGFLDRDGNEKARENINRGNTMDLFPRLNKSTT